MKVSHVSFEFIDQTPEMEERYALMVRVDQLLLARKIAQSERQASVDAVHLRQEQEDWSADRDRDRRDRAAKREARREMREIRATRPHLHFRPDIMLASPHADWFMAA